METISVRGAIFTKASVLAKKFNYTSDYIGQLCRANKVDAELVGRSWYVREDSLLVHKNSQYKNYKDAEITLNSNVEPVKTEPVRVMPVLSKTTKKLILNQPSPAHFADRLANITPLRYESDEVELVPQPNNSLKNKPVKLNVDISGSEKINVRSVEKGVKNLEFTELPSVVLQGNIKVNSFEAEGTAEPVAPVALPKKPLGPVRTEKKLEAAPEPIRFSPASVPEPVPDQSRGRSLVFASLVLSLIISAAILSIDSYVSFSAGSYHGRLVFNSASLGEILRFLGL